MLPAGALAGRVAIVTGGGTGIGRGIAHNFAALGAKVVLASRKRVNLERVVAEIEHAGGEALAFPTDVRVPEQIDALMQETKAHFGSIDILVNNAAGNFLAHAIDLSPNAWNAVVSIVLNGTWFCSQAAAKDMIAAGRGGCILNVIATYAQTGAPGTAHSGAAKAGVLNLTQSLAVEWAPHGIRVNAIAPGPVATENTTKQLFGGGELLEAIGHEVPLGRFGEVGEIADAAAYLVSDYARYITGANLTIDGGYSLNQGFMPHLRAQTSTRPH